MNLSVLKSTCAACLLMAAPHTSHAQQSVVESAPEPMVFSPLHGTSTQPAVARPILEPSVLVRQDVLTLEVGLTPRRDPSSIVDLRFLSDAGDAFDSRFRNTNGLSEGLAMLAALYSHPGVPAAATDGGCDSRATILTQQAKLDPSRLLELLEKEIAANPGCVCELVKAAILAADADADIVATIVETAILIEPGQMRMISQCAIAANPEALAAVQEVLVRLDPNAGESSTVANSAKSSKSGKEIVPPPPVQPPADPLDLPPFYPIPPPPFFPDPETAVNP